MKISVALCTYNGEKYIRQQLESIFLQTMSVTEIVVMDDCSSDSTLQIIHELDRQNPGVLRVFKNDQNVGFVKNFEKALRECSGDYIFFSDQDDVWHSNKVERVISFLDASGMWGVFTNGELIDGDGIKLRKTLFESLDVEKYLSQKVVEPDLFTMLSFNSNFVTGATLAVTKEAKQVILPFRTSKNIYHDHFIALKLSAMGMFACLNECLISYRIHQKQQIGIGKNGETYKSIFSKYKEAIYSDNKVMTEFCKFLIFRRRWSFKLANVCELDRSGRKLQKKRYNQLLFPLIKRLRFVQKCELILRYICAELNVTWRS